MSTENQLSEFADFSIIPCDTAMINPVQYKQLTLSKEQQSQLSMIQLQIPTLFTGGVAAGAYIAKFPNGLPHTMMRLNQGGVGSLLMTENGKIAGTASLYSVNTIGAVTSCFAVMSMITGQYYLENIHNDLRMINQKVDKILDFLYGDKSAELLSEISFVNDAYKNFNTIMQHETQKIATITNIQSSKKVAMKDIEFYVNDLANTVSTQVKNRSEFDNLISDALKIKDSLELSIQLYVMANVLEIYYSQNFEASYIDFIKESTSEYVSKCNNRILSSFSRLSGRNGEFKPKIGKKTADTSIDNRVLSVIDMYSTNKDMKTIVNILDEINTPSEYLLSSDGSVSLRTM